MLGKKKGAKGEPATVESAKADAAKVKAWQQLVDHLSATANRGRSECGATLEPGVDVADLKMPKNVKAVIEGDAVRLVASPEPLR